MYIIVGQYFDKKRGIAMSCGTVGCGVGAIAIAPLTAYLVEEYALFGTFLILGALMLNCAVAGMLFRPLGPKETTTIVYRAERKDGEAAENRSGSDDVLETIQDSSVDSAASERLQERSADCSEHLQTRDQKNDSLAYSGSTQNIIVEGTDESRNMDVERSYDPNGKASRQTNKGEKHTNSCRTFFQRFSMLKSLTYFLYCLTMMSICFGVQGTLTFLPALGLEKGFTPTQSAVLLSVAGFADIVGRFLNGIAFDLKPVRHRRRPLHCCVGIATGLAVVSFGLMPTFYSLVAMIILWGLVEGGWHGQRTTIVSEVASAEHQSSAIGISIFFQGLGNTVAPVTGGK